MLIVVMRSPYAECRGTTGSSPRMGIVMKPEQAGDDGLGDSRQRRIEQAVG